jgi:hypothetical protein
MKVYRVGAGRSPSGKVLDRETEWYRDYDTAVSRAKELKKRLYVSENGRKYKEIDI